MGRPPCCDKVGMKKGPWTPEEDIVLVSYIQEHGPGNWRAVPTNTELHRCSKSCRLRWTNYLRPGIKRGSFTDHEDKMIIHLQALLGNRWAAIASYLPQRTDNDVKNYWNTHLRKKIKKLQSGPDEQSHQSRDQWERRLQTDIHMARQALSDALSMDKKTSLNSSELKPASQVSTPTYASNTDNIARLLQGWMKKSPNQTQTNSINTQNSINNITARNDSPNSSDLSEAFESLFGFESFESSNNNSEFSQSMSPEASIFQDESKPDLAGQVPLSVLETWLFDEGASIGKEDLLTDMSLDDNADHLF